MQTFLASSYRFISSAAHTESQSNADVVGFVGLLNVLLMYVFVPPSSPPSHHFDCISVSERKSAKPFNRLGNRLFPDIAEGQPQIIAQSGTEDLAGERQQPRFLH